METFGEALGMRPKTFEGSKRATTTGLLPRKFQEAQEDPNGKPKDFEGLKSLLRA